MSDLVKILFFVGMLALIGSCEYRKFAECRQIFPNAFFYCLPSGR